MPRRKHSTAPATARSPEMTTDQPERFDHSVARSISDRIRSRSRLALPASSNFVTQSTLLQEFCGVKVGRTRHQTDLLCGSLWALCLCGESAGRLTFRRGRG